MKNSTNLPRLFTSVVLMGAFSFGCVNLPNPTAQNAMAAETAAPNFAPVPDDAPFAGEINDFLKADAKQMPPKGAILFAGSSSIRLWSTLKEDFPEVPVINRGFGGSHLSQNITYADRIAIPYQPKMIVLFAGTNDLASGKSPLKVLEDFITYANKIQQALPATRIVYLAISPAVSRWKNEANVMEANYLISKWIFENNSPTRKLNFISAHDQLLSADGQPQPALLREDGLHLNSEGYKVWKSIIKPRVLALAAIDGVERLNAPAK